MDSSVIRRRLARAGLVTAAIVPPASGGRAEEAALVPARLVEGDALAWHPVGEAAPMDEPVAFLDGVQHAEVVGYVGASPIVVATCAAAVRRRERRRLRTVVVRRARVVIGRASALDAAGEALGDLERLPIPDEVPGHPARELREAARLLDERRGALEVEAAARFRAADGGWLVVDGSLAESPAWAADPRMIGVVKSHATLPFAGDGLARYLRLPVGHRTNVFEPGSRRVAPVRSWALRLWPFEGRDLLHGLVRLEVAPALGTPAQADRLSRWILAERAPVSTPDPRWDRLLYGVQSVERYLRSS